MVTIEIDDSELAACPAAGLALYWHLVQASPVPFADKAAGELAERIGREIIRRWLRGVRPRLWDRLGSDYYWNELIKLGRWENGTFIPDAQPRDAAGNGTPGWACCGQAGPGGDWDSQENGHVPPTVITQPGQVTG